MAKQTHHGDELSQTGTDVLRAVCLHSLADMDQWAGPWQALDATSTAPHRYFQGHDWCRTWLVNHAGPRLQPFIILLLRGHELIAVLPLMRIRTKMGISVLRSLGDPHTQYGNVLTRHGSLTAAEARVMQDTLHANSGADCIIINYVPEGSPLTLLLGTETRANELDNEAAQLDLHGFSSPQDYRATLNKSRRRARRKAEVALGEFGIIRLEVLRPGDAGYAAAIARCVALKKSWIKHTGRIGSSLEFDDHARFLSELPVPVGRDGGIVFVLMAGTTAVAYEIGFLQNGHYYSYLGSFMWSLRHASPGTLQIEMTLEWLIANDVRTFDLLGNPMQYKAQWSNRQMMLACHILNLNTRGRLYSSVWVRRVRPKLKQLYHHLPTPARRSFAVFREIDLSQLKSA